MQARCFLRRSAAALALIAPVALISSLVSPREASAQTAQPQSVDLPKLNPSAPGDRFFGVPSPFAAGKATIHAGALLDYAHSPLILVDGTGKRVGGIIDHQMFLHLGVNIALFHRLALNVDMPFALLNRGDGVVTGGSSRFTSPNQAAIGDLRLGARIRLFGEYHDPFQIGIGGYLWAPTGTRDAFVTDGKVRGQPHLLLGGRADRFIWSAMLGPTLRSSVQIANVKLGHQFDWGAGVGLLLGANRQFQIGVETSGGVTLTEPAKRSTNAELLLGAKYRVVSPLELGLAVGPGLTNGVGTPDVRAVFGIQYTPEVAAPAADRDGDRIPDASDACPDVRGVASDDPKKNGCPPPTDRDGDGILDGADACVDVPGKPSADPKKNGCPVADSDEDGIVDDLDACPDVRGVPSDDPKENGCPAPSDKDGDGVVDELDACPDLPGVATNDPKTNGCPPDSDGDGFRDDQDACPHEKGVDDPDPTKRGCPKSVRVTDKEIIILEQVQFDTGKATIKKVSDPLLDAVAGVLKEHPEIAKIEVQGHTDDRGAKALNQRLSQDRAAAVVKAMEKRGIDGARLVAKGYGPDVPIAANDTDAGRSKNRRVQFVVLEKKEKAAR